MGKWKRKGNLENGKHSQTRRCVACTIGMMVMAALSGTMTGCSTVSGNADTVQEGNGQDDQIAAGTPEVSLEPEDQYTRWDESLAVKVELGDNAITIDGQGATAEGSVVTIEKEGTYVLRGTLSDGTILVDAGDDDLVWLVFDGVDIHSENSAAVDIKNAGKTIISLEEGTSNSLSDGAGYVYRNEEKEEPNAALFCKDDLTINGNGILKVTGCFNNGIGCKDTLKIVGGVYEITAANHGVKGNDALAVYGGRLNISAAGDGLKSDTLAVIADGDICVSDCEEGIEAETVAVYGGNIDLTARDDGINGATDRENSPEIYFAGGTVTVRAEGDGIDSNGSVYMSGGQVTVYGPSGRDNGALDYDGSFELTGGILVAFGPGGMEQNVSSADSQAAVLVDFQESKEAGTVVVLRDKDGKELYKGAGEKAFGTVVISVPGMDIGGEYEILAGDDVISFAPEQRVTCVNKEGIQETAVMGPGGRGRAGDGQPGERAERLEKGGDRERAERREGENDGERQNNYIA